MPTDTKIRIKEAVSPTDTSTFEALVAGETRSPTGCAVICCQATALNLDTPHRVISCGVTDFTDVGCCGASSVDGEVDNSSVSLIHNETNIINLLNEGASTIDRSFTIIAVAGGVRFTPVQSGVARRLMVILVFGSVCKAFSTNGDGTLSIDEEVAIAHGMATPPGAGIYFHNEDNLGTRFQDFMSIGFHADDGAIKQGSYFYHEASNAAPTDLETRIPTNRVAGVVSNTGAERYGLELTANDASNTTFTQRIAATSQKYIGLLIECDDIATDMLIVDTPTNAAADWNYNALAFTPQAVLMAMTRLTAVNTAEIGSRTGSWGCFGVDEDGSEVSVSTAAQDGVTPPAPNTNTQSRIDSKLYLPEQDGTRSFEMSNFAFTSDGWDVLDADVIDLDVSVTKWPMLAFEQAPVAAAPTPLSAAGIIVNP